MKILCPTDFSEASVNGIEYAAELATKINASITLINVQPLSLSDQVSLDSAKGATDEESAAMAKLLFDTSTEIKATFQVPCDYSLVSSGDTFAKALARESSKYNLTIIGTNGANNLNQFYFGSHSYRMAKESSMPVIIVPETASFNLIDRVVFASDNDTSGQLPLEQLKEFTDLMNAEILVLHVSKDDNEISQTIYRSFCNIVQEKFQYDNRIHFKRIIADDTASGIESFINENEADLLTLAFEEHSWLYRLFNEDLIKKMTSYSAYPIMIFHK